MTTVVLLLELVLLREEAVLTFDVRFFFALVFAVLTELVDFLLLFDRSFFDTSTSSYENSSK